MPGLGEPDRWGPSSDGGGFDDDNEKDTIHALRAAKRGIDGAVLPRALHLHTPEARMQGLVRSIASIARQPSPPSLRVHRSGFPGRAGGDGMCRSICRHG